MTDKITLSLDKTGRNGYQISINLVGQHGYRLLGPKYLGDSEELAVRTLDEWDAREIRQYLDHIDGGDTAAEQRGFDRAVALLRDGERFLAWSRAHAEARGNFDRYPIATPTAIDADAYLEAHGAAPAVLGNGEQA